MARHASLPEQALFNERQPAIVAIVDDDPEVRKALHSLVRSVGIEVKAFGSIQEFLANMDPEHISCLVLDVRLPGRNGLDFQDELRRTNVTVPVVFISGYGDIPMAVRAMKAGALEFLPKPFRNQDLLDVIQLGIEQDRVRRARERTTIQLQTRYAMLTSREREVMRRISHGQRNKEVAVALGISEVTVKAHRHQVMRKMGAARLAELIRMSDALDATRS
jgi:FixJ family two-component response regulator